MPCFQDCQFTKIKDNTTLHVVFQGNIYWEVAVATASDGSLLSMAPSVAVRCLLTQLCGSPIVTRTTTDMEQ